MRAQPRGPRRSTLRAVRRLRLGATLCLLAVLAAPALAGTAAVGGDFDSNGFVDHRDFAAWEDCARGPRAAAPSAQCRDAFDLDSDGCVTLADFASFQLGFDLHTEFPLRDYRGNAIALDSTEPYSGRHTCGGCHDLAQIANGFLFQMGRTDIAGELIMHADYYADGRYWISSPGRYGTWGQSFVYQLAAKANAQESRFDQGTFAWIRDCGGCHPGGGAGEYDRDGVQLYDAIADLFGFEFLGRTPAEVRLDGDYADLNYANGAVRLAPWDVTGLSGPDCLYCHRRNRAGPDGRGGADFARRRAVLAAGDRLVNSGGAAVPAFAAAGSAGQGWFSRWDAAASPPVLDLDYRAGLADGSLVEHGGEAWLAPAELIRPPRDQACVACHPLATVTGSVWFDERDVMYRALNRLNDADPANDVPPAESTACNTCHPGGLHHNFAKGNSPQIQYRNELDYLNLRSCRSCHLESSPTRHPDAPPVPGASLIHNAGDGVEGPLASMSCQACHIPYALTAGLVFRDITIPGATGTTTQYYSADPLDPAAADRHTWYPALIWKTDSDGVQRLFPAAMWLNIYWGDWDTNGTPGVLTDDVIAPLAAWRVAQVVGPTPLPVVTDDNGDGQLEINRAAELRAYFQVLQQPDVYGVPVAARPVLVKGVRVWYADPDAPDGVASFDHRGTGIPITAYPYLWGMDHNVLAAELAWGAGFPPACGDCHRHDGRSLVFDRKILVDPYGLDGAPVYETVRQMTGVVLP